MSEKDRNKFIFILQDLVKSWIVKYTTMRCSSSSPFPFVPLQRRGGLVAALFLWIVLVSCEGD
jgi:hypothetical protein